MLIQEVVVSNRLGLHAWACAKVVEVASRFQCEVSLAVGARRASARNIIAVMLLSASVGSVVRLETDGPDEARAMREFVALFHEGFGER
jgi:phosphocarrier protein HPr